jgi:hypothetical protein
MRLSAQITVAAWIACLSNGVYGAQIPGDPSDLFADASAAFAAGDYAAAAASFEAARAAGMDGPAVEYNAGVSYYRLGAFERAEHVFRSLAQSYPDMRALADYNLGLVLTRQSRTFEAREAFERARLGGDPAIAALADAMLERTDDQAPVTPGVATRWIGLFDVAVGYDDNVALLDESSLPAGMSTESPLLEAYGYVSGRVGAESAVRIDASAYLVRYSRAGEFDQDGLQLAVAYLWEAGNWQIDAGSHYNYSTLAGEGFERRIGASMTARYPLGEATSMLLRYVHDDVGALSDDYRFVKGTRDRLSVGLEQRGERGKLALGYVRERNDRLSPNVSPERHEVFAGYQLALTADWSVGVQGLLRASRYEQLAEPRDEDLSQVSVTATRDFGSGWQLFGAYRVSENSSNVDLFSYDRNRLVFSLNRLF